MGKKKDFLELDKEYMALSGNIEKIKMMFDECRYLQQLASPQA